MIDLYWVSQYNSMLDIMIKTINSRNIIFIKNKIIYLLTYLLTYVELPFDPSLQFSSNHHESS